MNNAFSENPIDMCPSSCNGSTSHPTYQAALSSPPLSPSSPPSSSPIVGVLWSIGQHAGSNSGGWLQWKRTLSRRLGSTNYSSEPQHDGPSVGWVDPDAKIDDPVIYTSTHFHHHSPLPSILHTGWSPLANPDFQIIRHCVEQQSPASL